ncbi:hypothetical protein [Marinicrinis lubricantis]|uniref:Uncharacterized protein n=1 Tax=Marinicrinis lubricantis TaxID=2086470 RepID=A0ABW1IN59_9BACL
MIVAMRNEATGREFSLKRWIMVILSSLMMAGWTTGCSGKSFTPVEVRQDEPSDVSVQRTALTEEQYAMNFAVLRDELENGFQQLGSILQEDEISKELSALQIESIQKILNKYRRRYTKE